MEKVLLPREFLEEQRFCSLLPESKAALFYLWMKAEPHGIAVLNPEQISAWVGCQLDMTKLLEELRGIVFSCDEGRRLAIPLWVRVNYKHLKSSDNARVSCLDNWSFYGILDFLPSSLLPKELRSKPSAPRRGAQGGAQGKGEGEGKGKGEEREKGGEGTQHPTRQVWDDEGLRAIVRVKLGSFASPGKIKELLALVDAEDHGELRKVITQEYQDSGPAFETAQGEFFASMPGAASLMEKLSEEIANNADPYTKRLDAPRVDLRGVQSA